MAWGTLAHLHHRRPGLVFADITRWTTAAVPDALQNAEFYALPTTGRIALCNVDPKTERKLHLPLIKDAPKSDEREREMYPPLTRAPHATRPCSARCSIPGAPGAFHTRRRRCPQCRFRSDSSPPAAARPCCVHGNATAGTASTRPWSSADRAHCRSSGTCRAYPAPGPCTVNSPRHPPRRAPLRCHCCWLPWLHCCHLTSPSPSPLFPHAGSSASDAVGRCKKQNFTVVSTFYLGTKNNGIGQGERRWQHEEPDRTIAGC